MGVSFIVSGEEFKAVGAIKQFAWLELNLNEFGRRWSLTTGMFFSPMLVLEDGVSGEEFKADGTLEGRPAKK